jgi:peptidoglycan/LPS O-acetylase OafA/YrhL
VSSAGHRLLDHAAGSSRGSTRTTGELGFKDYLQKNHRSAFDGLRAIGFLLVITAHVPAVPLFRHLQGWTAVWLFLVISGYLLTMLMMREEKSQGRVALGPFLVKRFCRIVPGYWAAILIYGAACVSMPQLAGDLVAFTERLPSYLAFVPEYADGNEFSIFTHSWTVGVELKFYLAFPPVMFLLLKSPAWRFVVLAVSAILLIAHGSFIAQSYCALLFGAMLALAMERRDGYAIIAKLTRVSLAVPAAAVVACLVMLHHTPQLTIVAVTATYLVAYAIVQEARVANVLTWRPLVYLGQRSYGAYLLHFLALRIGYMAFGNETATEGFLAACFCLAVTVPAAELMYRAVERPALDFGRWFLRKRDRLGLGQGFAKGLESEPIELIQSRRWR